MNGLANLLVLPSKSSLAVGTPEGFQGGSKEGTLGGFGAPLGLLGTHLGSVSDRFEAILGLFEDLFGIIWGIIWESLFRFFGIRF